MSKTLLDTHKAKKSVAASAVASSKPGPLPEIPRNRKPGAARGTDDDKVGKTKSGGSAAPPAFGGAVAGAKHDRILSEEDNDDDDEVESKKLKQKKARQVQAPQSAAERCVAGDFSAALVYAKEQREK